MTAQIWTRRRLLQAAAITAGGYSMRTLAAALPAQQLSPAITVGSHQYLAIPATSSEPAGLLVLTRSAAGWQPRQFFPAPRLRLLLADTEGQFLYAANSRQMHRGEPAGHVEVFRIDPHTGLLKPSVRQSLALSAATPVGMALSPQRTLLVVAAAEGVFSLLPVHAHGALQQVTAAHKQILAAGDARKLERIYFTGTSQLLVQHSNGLQTYHCDTDGMQPAS